MTRTMTTAAHMTGEEGLMSFLRQNMEYLASYGPNTKVTEDDFNDVVNRFLSSVREVVKGLRCERVVSVDGATVEAGNGVVAFSVSIDREAVTAALEAAKRDCDRFH